MAKDIRIVKNNRGPLTVCGVEVYGYKSGSSSTSMSWELATESSDEDTVKSTMDTYNETIEIDNSTESSGNSSDFDLSFHQGWRSWSASLGAYKIKL
jgi:hypothetical protein